MADQKLTALSEISVPALEDLGYTVDDPSGIPVSNKVTWSRLLGLIPVCQGRLTLTSGTAVTTADVTGATSVYFTPYNGNLVRIYDGTRWRLYTFTELTLALGTLTSGANYDVFVYDNAGTLTLILGPAWTSDTARGTGAGTTELELFEGVHVNKVAIASGPGARAGLYLGTFRTTATTTTEDSYGGASQAGGKRFLWNAHNRVRRHIGVIDTTDSWTYATATWRSANATAGNKVEYVCGLSQDMVVANVFGRADVGNTHTLASGVGVDSTSATSAALYIEAVVVLGALAVTPILASYRGFPGIGYHYLQWLEYVRLGTTTIYGDGGIASTQSGLHAEVMA